ncbi:hypothetical protein EV175_005235 [Coemansia sp. RSA 1933]|nr:hypothetical protein EV175_005235 [Coemansia sp. RSA 1933]
MFCSRARALQSRCLWSLNHTQTAQRHFTIAIDGPAASGKSSTARAVARDLGLGYIDSGSIYRCATLLALRKGIEPSEVSNHTDEIADLISKASLQIKIQRTTDRPTLTMIATGRLEVPPVQVLLNDEDVSREIRTPDINRLVAKVASASDVREAALRIQRSLAQTAESRSAGLRQPDGGDAETMPGGVVMDGRDIGTTVFPNAELKIYLDASAMARAIRRWDEMNSQAKEDATAKRRDDAAADQSKSEDTEDYHPSVEDIARELEQRDYEDINREHSPLRIAPDAVVIDNTNLTFEQQVYSIADLARERMGLARKHDDIPPFHVLMCDACPDHYAVLGVRNTATRDEIKRAYYTLSRQVHPDKSQQTTPAPDNGLSVPTSIKFHELSTAWEVLRDESRRAEYDTQRSTQQNRARGVVQDEVDLDDMDHDESAAVFSYPCRCSSQYEIHECDLDEGRDIAPCSGCSLKIRVLYDIIED